MKVRRVISTLLCSSMLMLSVMPVSAGACTHVNLELTITSEYRYVDSDNHEYCHNKIFTCWACGDLIRTEKSKGEEGHSKGTIADLGHISPLSHKYKIGCTKCGGCSYELIVPCADH